MPFDMLREFLYRFSFFAIILALNALIFWCANALGWSDSGSITPQFHVYFSIFCTLFLEPYLALMPPVCTCAKIDEKTEGEETKVTIGITNHGKRAVTMSVKEINGIDMNCIVKLFDNLDDGEQCRTCRIPTSLKCTIPARSQKYLVFVFRASLLRPLERDIVFLVDKKEYHIVLTTSSIKTDISGSHSGVT
jgi:hypothetical protein